MDLSAATQKLVHSNQLDDESFTQKKIAQAFQDLVSVDLGMDEEAVNRAAALRRGKQHRRSFLLVFFFTTDLCVNYSCKGHWRCHTQSGSKYRNDLCTESTAQDRLKV